TQMPVAARESPDRSSARRRPGAPSDRVVASGGEIKPLRPMQSSPRWFARSPAVLRTLMRCSTKKVFEGLSRRRESPATELQRCDLRPRASGKQLWLPAGRSAANRACPHEFGSPILQEGPCPGVELLSLTGIGPLAIEMCQAPA